MIADDDKLKLTQHFGYNWFMSLIVFLFVEKGKSQQ